MNSSMFVIVLVIFELICPREAAAICKPIYSCSSEIPREGPDNSCNKWPKVKLDLTVQNTTQDPGINVTAKHIDNLEQTNKQYFVPHFGTVEQINSNYVRKKRYKRSSSNSRKNNEQFAHLDDSGIYYEPADTLIPTQIYNKHYFYVSNPIKNNDNVLQSDSASDLLNINIESLSERIVLNQKNIDEDTRSLETPLYLDIDIKNSKFRQNNNKNDLIDNPLEAEENLIECMDLHILLFSKNRNTTYRQMWNQNRIKEYELLTDTEIKYRLNSNCNKTATMLRYSMEDVLKQKEKEKSMSEDLSNVDFLNNILENPEKVNTEQNYDPENFQTTIINTFHTGIVLTTKKNPLNKIYQSTQIPQEEIDDNLEHFYDLDNETTEISFETDKLNKKLNIIANNDVTELYGNEINNNFTTERDQFQDSSSMNFKLDVVEISTTMRTPNTVFEDIDNLELESATQMYILFNNDKKTIGDVNTEAYENVTTTYENIDFIESEDNNVTNTLLNEEEGLIKEIITDKIAQVTIEIDSNIQPLTSTKDINLTSISTTMKHDSLSYLNSTESTTSESDAISTTFFPLTENSKHDSIITITDSANKYSHEDEINEANMSNSLEVNGKVYFVFNGKQIPMRFIQKPDGEVNMGIDGHHLCKILLNDPKHNSLLLTKLCNSS